jgi:AraC-like DNA-binding protein
VRFLVEAIGSTEQRLSFRAGDSWCRLSTMTLATGVRLDVTECEYEPSFAFDVVQPPAELSFVASKGNALLVHTQDGREVVKGGNVLQLERTTRPLPLRIRAPGEVHMECVTVSMSEERVRELLGMATLPGALRKVTASKQPHHLVSQETTPRLFRLLEEILHADVKQPSRSLWYRAKSLEFVALMTDELVETERAGEAALSAHDIDRLERARRRLIERLDASPTLAELAREAGFSETKLKVAFRALFGTSVFAYLRRARMEEARRLLSKRGCAVTEAAQRVGYANPSKFAVAFRREFGMSPSEV